MSTQEIWKPVIGYEDWYEVSSLGNVKRVAPERGAKVGKHLKVRYASGYLVVWLSRNSEVQAFTVHTLVAEAFLGPRSKGQEINHKDFRTSNNRLDNLEYLTHQENVQHTLEQGRWDYRGEKHPGARLTNEQVEQMRLEFASGNTALELAKKYEIAIETASRILQGKSYKAAGGPIASEVRAAGEKKTGAKLTAEQVKEMRELHETGKYSGRKLAKMFGIGSTTARTIIDRKKWKHL